jgi:hypothetical protein
MSRERAILAHFYDVWHVIKVTSHGAGRSPLITCCMLPASTTVEQLYFTYFLTSQVIAAVKGTAATRSGT